RNGRQGAVAFLAVSSTPVRGLGSNCRPLEPCLRAWVDRVLPKRRSVTGSGAGKGGSVPKFQAE
ncbi:MAG: hypothetical protein RR861_09300, partial [Glutamicibacter sp.]|uniref:hypothetical protein n=1 Tax=Glutamicibacter sp. TaxID=1931995 RepID=UPI002FCC55D2